MSATATTERHPRERHPQERHPPVYASRAATEQARRLGVGCVEQEVARRRSELTRYDRRGGQEPGSWWLHADGWSAHVRRGPARLDKERRALHVVEVQRA